MTEIADERRQQGEGVRERAESTMQDAASATQEKAMELRSRGSDQLRQQLDTRTTDAGREARSVAQALRQSGENLRGEGKSQAASVTTGAADRVEQLAQYLERVDGDQLLKDAEQFARRRPWLIAGMSMVAGLLASRMMKASSERRFESSAGRPGSSPHSPSSQQQYGHYGDVGRGV